MCCEDHAASSVGDAVSGVGGDVVEELCDGVVGCFCGRGLLLAKFAESYKQLVIDGAAIKQERTHDGLYAEDARFVKGSAVISFGRVLDFGAVNDLSVFVRGVLRFPGVSVVEFDSEVGNIVVHCKADCALGVHGVVVPLQVDAGVKIALPVHCDAVVFFKDCFEVEGVSFANVLNTKVIN